MASHILREKCLVLTMASDTLSHHLYPLLLSLSPTHGLCFSLIMPSWPGLGSSVFAGLSTWQCSPLGLGRTHSVLYIQALVKCCFFRKMPFTCHLKRHSHTPYPFKWLVFSIALITTGHYRLCLLVEYLFDLVIFLFTLLSSVFKIGHSCYSINIYWMPLLM